MLGSSEAMGIYWGAEHTLLYNDAAIEQIGQKHPDALGQPAPEVFPEAWDELGPIHDRVLADDGPVCLEKQYLPLNRAGELEDIWWDSTFNPIPVEDGSVGGVLNISFDVTDRLLAQRELRAHKRESEPHYKLPSHYKQSTHRNSATASIRTHHRCEPPLMVNSLLSFVVVPFGNQSAETVGVDTPCFSMD